MVTPLTSAHCLDLPGVERLVSHLIGGGVSGIFILGTTGEGPSLSYSIRRELIEVTCTLAANRVPVLVGVTDTAFCESLQIANFAARCGASAVVVAPPPYFHASQTELLGYLRRLADASTLPVLLYNMPALTKTVIEAETVRAAADHPNIVGLKDSSGDMTYFHRVRRLLEDREDFTVLVGPEELLAESVLFGAHGGVSGGANLRPELYVQLYEAARAENLELVRSLHARVMALSSGLYGIAGGGASLIRSLKYALSLRGICMDGMSEPFVPIDPLDRQRVADCLAQMDPAAAIAG